MPATDLVLQGLFVRQGELLENGDFSWDLAPWVFHTQNGAQASASLSQQALCVDVQAAGQNSWDIQLLQEKMDLQQGKSYTVRFSAWGLSPRPLTVGLAPSQAPWTAYGYKTVQLSTSKQSFSVTMPMQSPSDSAARLVLDMGGSGADLCLDDVSLVAEP